MNIKISCIIMASGVGRRFGGDKLMALFNGVPLMEYAIKNAQNPVFFKAAAITRSRAAARLCSALNMPYILHTYPLQSDTIRIGITEMYDSDGCCFMSADQPLMSSDSILRLTTAFTQNPDKICRLCYGSADGNPVIFPRILYNELMHLPPDRGGNALIKKHPEQVIRVPVRNAYELFDIDTKDDLNKLIQLFPLAK